MASFRNIPSNVLGKLFNQYCCNMYGIVLCDLRSSSLFKLCVSHRKAIRRMYKLPARTHCDLLPLVTNLQDLHNCAIKRVLKFYINLCKSCNPLVKYIATRCTTQCLSNMGKNVYLFSKFCNIYDIVNANIEKVASKMYLYMKPKSVLFTNNNIYVADANTCTKLVLIAT